MNVPESTRSIRKENRTHVYNIIKKTNELENYIVFG
jgi:hypothetical protein